jgi:hypothetical protein
VVNDINPQYPHTGQYETGMISDVTEPEEEIPGNFEWATPAIQDTKIQPTPKKATGI